MELRILDWNVQFNNIHAFSTISNLLSTTSYDIICLQEVSWDLLQKLHTLTQFTVQENINFLSFSKPQEKSRYIVTLSKLPVLDTREIELNNEKLHSLQAQLLYRGIYNQEQRLVALKTVIQLPEGQQITILNTHLPCATGTQKRIDLLAKLLNSDDSKKSIICGDFNIMDSPFLNLISGWFRGFTFTDYRLNERVETQTLCAKHNYQNSLANHVTCSVTKIPRLQFDHILVPQNVEILNSGTLQQKGSDHFPIFTIVDIP